jgi:hypothetical protein
VVFKSNLARCSVGRDYSGTQYGLVKPQGTERSDPVGSMVQGPGTVHCYIININSGGRLGKRVNYLQDVANGGWSAVEEIVEVAERSPVATRYFIEMGKVC